MQTLIDLRLARHGAILLLLGMLTGFVIRHCHNPKAGNAAHLSALIGGYGLVAVGVLWPRLKLGRFWSSTGAWITAVSLYLNWLGPLILAVLGTGPGATSSVHLGSTLLWDKVGGAILAIAVILSLLSAIILLVGLRSIAGSSHVSANMVRPTTT